ncbi:MAG: 50S ribosomal protein L25 [Pirellulales bacterium]|nr:50S ribosomal protein L25 [Pirellulales bacterium]
MSEVLKVELRNDLGKRHTRRLRRAGSVPCILYGHGEKVVNLAASAEQMAAVIRHGSRIVDLEGAVSEKALLRDLQWDVYGIEVLHADLTRVSLDEKVQVTLSVEMRGEAAGIRDGGVIELLQHEVEIDCPAGSIPEKLVVNVNHLGLGQTLTFGKLELPAGASLVSDPHEVVVSCHLPVEAKEEEVGAEGAEPEIIGRAASEEEEEEE